MQNKYAQETDRNNPTGPTSRARLANEVSVSAFHSTLLWANLQVIQYWCLQPVSSLSQCNWQKKFFKKNCNYTGHPGIEQAHPI